MLKKIIHIGIVFLLIVYFIFIVIFINPNLNREKCTKVVVDIAGNDTVSYVSTMQVYSFLKEKKLDPIKKNMLEINTKTIEKTLEKHGFIKKAEVYKTIGSAVRIKIYQRIPILRIISNNIDYYIDSDRKIISIPVGFAVCVPLASGIFDEKFAIEKLYPLAVFLQKNEFWNAQIEQIYVNNDLEIELIPRLGNYRIVLGEMKNFENKLDNLIFFYKKVLNVLGWNRYSIINLKYRNQIVCTKN
jgi:cell division protein FtsQ